MNRLCIGLLLCIQTVCSMPMSPENIASLKNVVIGQLINHGFTTSDAYSTIHSILEEKDTREKAAASNPHQKEIPLQSVHALKRSGFTQMGVSRITQQLFQIANNCGIDKAKELFS